MIKVIIFDLDGTLYADPQVLQKFAEAAYNLFAEVRKIPVEKAEEIIEERRGQMKEEKGFTVPYTITLKTLGIPTERWHEANIKYFNPGDYLKQDARLKTTLQNLRENYKLAILTNNNEIQTQRILRALGIEKLFTHVFNYNSFKIIKPDPEVYKRAVEKMEVSFQECLVIGDRLEVDLAPAKELGMKVLEVKGPEDLYNLPDLLLSRKIS